MVRLLSFAACLFAAGLAFAQTAECPGGPPGSPFVSVIDGDQTQVPNHGFFCSPHVSASCAAMRAAIIRLPGLSALSSRQ